MISHALIVGCDDDEQMLVRTMLGAAVSGIRVSEVSDAVSFAGAISRADPQLVVVVRRMGWADGLALVKLVRQTFPNCATILLGETEADQADPDAQPDAHLSRTVAGLAKVGHVAVRAAERRARISRSEAGFSALDSLPVAVLQLGADERVLDANAAAVALLGHHDAAALAGRALAELVGESDAPTDRARAGPIAATVAAVPSGLSVLALRRVGTPVKCRLVVRTETREGVLIGFVATLLPRYADSGSGTGKLLYAISHDLQQPVATVSQSAHMLTDHLQANGRLDAEEERMLRRIRSGTMRMEALIGGLLEYVRTGQESPTSESFDLAAVLEEVVQGMQAGIEESGAVIRWGELPTIQASRSDCTRLVENLLSNAVKFRGPAAPLVDVACVDRGDSWLLSVRDNGVGIDPAQVERVFEPFQRLHSQSEFPGTGIGLAICRQICERHGGRIWVTANPDAGSTFFATIPKPAI